MADLPTLVFKEGEARTGVQFTIKQSDSAINLSTATLTMSVKAKLSDTTAAFTKSDSDFDKTDAADGIVTVNFSASDLATVGSYVADIKIVFSASDTRKTEQFRFVIEDAVTS